MRIAIASMGNPRTVLTWSGIPAHVIYALEKRGHEVIPIALKEPQEPWYFNWLRRLYFRTQKKWFLSSVEKKVLEIIGKQLDKEVDESKPDVVIVIHGDFLSYAAFKQPAVILHDTTFETLVNYYPEFTNLTKRSIAAGNNMYQRALERCDAAVFSSSWASNSAINDYKTKKSKVYTIPFGANLSEAPKFEEVANWISEREKSSYCKFLFLSVNWERKGGPGALKIVAALNKMGVESKLIVVGCNPDVPPEYKDFVEITSFLNKAIPEDAERLKNLLKESSALLLPSFSECYGCVYCEANAYGLPVLGRDTGGVSEIIKDGKNGLLFVDGETPENFATRWAKIWTRKDAYKQMAVNARHEYEEKLNYDVFTKKLETVLTSII